MSEFTNKIDFEVLVMVKNANPNGDPLNGNRPRETYDGFGEISDVCIKRKIRNRLQDMGENIFVQSDERSDDGCKSLADRAKSNEIMQKALKSKDKEAYAKEACKTWIDVRTFGQVFAFKDNSVSVGVRGPVSIHSAFSVLPVAINSMQITKSVNSADSKDGKASDTMGTKHRIGFGLYVIKGSVNVQLAEKTGFSQEDADLLREALKTLYENDASSARPEGSMEVCRLYWWQHAEKMPAVSSARVHRSVKIRPKTDRPASFADYEITYEDPGCAEPEVYDFV